MNNEPDIPLYTGKDNTQLIKEHSDTSRDTNMPLTSDKIQYNYETPDMEHTPIDNNSNTERAITITPINL